MDIEVNMGDIAVTRRSEDDLVTSGIGSCLVVMLYDPKFKIGALAHTMLSDRRVSDLKHDALDETSSSARNWESGCERRHEMRNVKYVDTAIDEMIKKMVTQGANKENIEAKGSRKNNFTFLKARSNSSNLVVEYTVSNRAAAFVDQSPLFLCGNVC